MPRRTIWGLRIAGLTERKCQPALTALPSLCLLGEHTGEGESGCHAISAALLSNGSGGSQAEVPKGSEGERKLPGVGVCFLWAVLEVCRASAHDL